MHDAEIRAYERHEASTKIVTHHRQLANVTIRYQEFTCIRLAVDVSWYCPNGVGLVKQYHTNITAYGGRYIELTDVTYLTPP